MIYSFICAALWASTGVFIKLIGTLSINQIIFWRFTLAASGSLFLIQSIRSGRFKLSNLPLPLLMTVYYIAASYSFYFSPIAVAALLIAISPLFTLMIRGITKDQIHKNEIAGFIVAFIGLAMFLSESGEAQGYTLHSILIGGSMALLAALVRAVYSWMIWHMSQQESVTGLEKINLHTFFIGIVLFAPLVSAQPSTYDLNFYSVAGLAGLAIVSTLIPNILNNKASETISPSIHNTIGMSTPVFASMMAWIFLGEAQTVVSILYMFIVLAGILITTRRPAVSN
ncbi:DMT family transporter [Oceanospirillum sediminis]|uniref:EamA family transporter n=1 Tax=Oceanospirillum sediminis TaxID=2760088 RepID=A0A839ISZ4_9GAMM|nr:DMT family transporter [Oceanospirillum sediminis]MBB1488573.1 EamA family transporter [Oceanospirillum sediminis]